MARGTVKWFNGAKGFGFIQPDDGGSDVFVHISAVEQAGLHGLNDGDLVTYELEQDRRSGKLSAGQLVVTGSGPPPAGGARGGGGGFDRPQRSFDRPPRSFDGPRAGGGGGASRDPAGPGSGVVQRHQGLRLHPAQRWWRRRVRPHLGG